MTSEDLDDQVVHAPGLTEDDAFGSHTGTGFLQYRLPAPNVLLNIPPRYLDSYHTMTFILMVMGNDGLNDEQLLSCRSESYCRISYVRSYTPLVHYLSPPVVYFEAETEVFFNPKITQNLIKSTLAADEMVFINAKIDGNQIDFEFNVDHETTFHAWYKYNSAKGVVGD